MSAKTCDVYGFAGIIDLKLTAKATMPKLIDTKYIAEKMMLQEKETLLLKFKVMGKLRYLSHRETMSVFERALIRLGIDLYFTQGFNPRPKVSLPLPRSVGLACADDMFCAELIAGGESIESLSAKMQEQLPCRIEVTEVRLLAGRVRPQALKAVYGFTFGSASESLKSKVDELTSKIASGEELLVTRAGGKRGPMPRQVDVLLYIESVDYDGEQLSQDGFEVFFVARQQVEFYDDVIPCLDRLQRNFRLGSITNGNASVEHVGLGGYFEHSVSAADLMVAKPDPLIYQHLAERFETDPKQIVYVGDHPVYDVLGSLEAGFQAVWINRENLDWPHHSAVPEHQVRDLHQLEVLLVE